ncbi:hypothetical protein ACIGNX_27330 [Actinosynnema sp. NPDC053489]|uniref:hypothetical protein n=1 Tax=Actinosynnema sp. NPDC053489 TaxID=3363916 RepID=UPI0037C5CEDD
MALSPVDVEVARAVVAAWYPAESEVFDDTVEDFMDDPSRTVRGVRPSAPVGMGIELATMTPYVLSAVGFLGGVVAEKVVGNAYDAIRERLRRARARREAGEPGEPVDAATSGQAVVVVVVHLVEQGADEQAAREVAGHVVSEWLGGSGPAGPGR